MHDFRELPISGKLYSINQQGFIQDITGTLVPTFYDSEGDLVANLYWIEGLKNYKVSLLIAFTFLPVHIPVKYWNKLNILFKDNNKLNFNLCNLVWKFPSTGIECIKNKGYFYIPNFTRYCISRNGSVIRHFFGKVMEGGKRKDGYHYFSLATDVNKENQKRNSIMIGRHRLLAITFIDYPADVDSLDVNHINGIPGDDWLENLEFLTRANNVLHAYENGLRNDNKPVLVKNHNTGVMTKYFSARECERKMNLKRGVLFYRLRKGSDFITTEGFSFSYEIDTLTIKEKPIPVRVINLTTGETKNFDSLTQCSQYLDISKKVIQSRLKDIDFILYKDYRIEKILI